MMKNVYRFIYVQSDIGQRRVIFYIDFYCSTEMLLNKQFAHLTTCLWSGFCIIDSFRTRARRPSPSHCGSGTQFPATNNILIRRKWDSLGNSCSFPTVNETSYADNGGRGRSKVKWNGMLWQYAVNMSQKNNKGVKYAIKIAQGVHFNVTA